MKAARLVLVIAASLSVADCRDETGPTAPAAPAPVIAGTWNGTVTCDKNGRRSPVTVKFEQRGPDLRVVSGSMTRFNCDGCGTNQIYARLVEALPWGITGTVSYKSVWCYPYYDYSASLTGSLEGSPVSRISARTGPFKSNRAGSKERPGIQLELTTRSAP